MLSVDFAPLMDVLKSSNAIALIKLSSPALNIKLISIYTKSDETGKVTIVFGKSFVGNGLTGENLKTKSLHQASKLQNVMGSTHG
ncbi:hypothetical protein [Pseudoalteromonas rhizosphaerae]|uniref:Uncharacterized protein n=1 Tax=Pseudoalteromonas rhizosphaerae TaxID=2518973 RepID=A0ABW8L170_9GAMM